MPMQESHDQTVTTAVTAEVEISGGLTIHAPSRPFAVLLLPSTMTLLVDLNAALETYGNVIIPPNIIKTNWTLLSSHT